MVETKVELLETTLRRALGGKEPYEHQLEFGREVLADRNTILISRNGERQARGSSDVGAAQAPGEAHVSVVSNQGVAPRQTGTRRARSSAVECAMTDSLC